MEQTVTGVVLIHTLCAVACIGGGNRFVNLSRVKINQTVCLQSCQEKGALTSWTFNEALLFIGNSLISDEISGSITLLKNKSIFIEHVSLSHDGTYQCESGSSSLIYYVEIEGLLCYILNQRVSFPDFRR